MTTLKALKSSPSLKPKSKLDKESDKLDDLIRRKFSARFMSDAKWRKLLAVLSDVDDIGHCDCKLIWTDEIRRFWLENIHENYDFYNKSVEALISGEPRGFYSYKEVEWLRFSHPQRAEILAMIQALGKFELDIQPDYFRLICYR